MIREPQFYTYAVSGSFTFCGLFAYVAGSPLVFMDVFELSKKQYGWVFAGISIGFIGSSQLNALLLKYFKSEQLVMTALSAQVVLSFVFWFGAIHNWYGLGGTIAMIFMIFCCVGLTNPNTSALSMASFSRNGGIASALLGTMQLTLGAVTSFFVSFFSSHSVAPMAGIMAISCIVGFLVLLAGRRHIVHKIEVGPSMGSAGH